MAAVLRLQEKVPVETLAQNVRNARAMGISTHYEPEEIKKISGPSQSDYDALIAKLKGEGFKVTQESPTHLWLSVQADSSNFERVFSTRIVSPRPGIHHNLDVASVPSHLSLVASVIGLDNTHKRHPLYHQMSGAMDAPGGVPQATIKSAYGFNAIYASGVTGKGQDIAIATYDGFNIDDVKYFYTQANLSPGIDEVDFNGKADYVEGSAMETQLDAEFSGMIAPGANVHVFPSAANSDAGELQMFTAILDDNRAKVVNYSWGACETNLTPAHAAEMDKVFARAVAQGVNIVVASGDSGSDSCGDGTNAADWPAAHPDVVAVGGTTFTANGDGYGSEAAWSGSGGGISALWASPAYQAKLTAPYNTKRSYPDVAFNADPSSGQAVYAHNQGTAGWIVIGGTSMAAPQWSGFLALVGESRASVKNLAPLGFLNPHIYALTDAQRAAVFHDVTSGSNGLYSAGPGFDAVTGLGSMQADQLLAILSSN
ncbi:MAG: S53 family peptidase [Oligoflexia bacterium]|nr:S53 family peptidase [Oligoflexia bacterium]